MIQATFNDKTNSGNLPSLLSKEWILPASTIASLEGYYLLKWSRKFFLLSLYQDGTNKDSLVHQGAKYTVSYKNTTLEELVYSNNTSVFVSFRKTVPSSGVTPVALVKLIRSAIPTLPINE